MLFTHKNYVLLLFIYHIVIVSLSIGWTCFFPQRHGIVVYNTYRPIQYGLVMLLVIYFPQCFVVGKCASAWLLLRIGYHIQTTGSLLFTQHLDTYTNTKTVTHSTPLILSCTHSHALPFTLFQRTHFPSSLLSTIQARSHQMYIQLGMTRQIFAISAKSLPTISLC